MLLPLEFYQRPDVLAIARELLGKHVCTRIEGELTTGRIVETEAYRHEGDPSITLHLQRKKRQAQALYQPGGHAYLYTVYRVHTLFNLTVNDAEHPDAVLIRAIEPLEGVEIMLRRRGLTKLARNLTAGPGVLSQALGLAPTFNGELLTGPRIWLEDAGEVVENENITASSRVGLEYAGTEAVALPWRFRVTDSKWTSPAK
ncbi:DNA-3-methyladenine glycosylase [Hymenobacter sp. HMF4947]|uniref:Putative 3-methyladenine DNA glycosylase n=1 Tax=Hymenobacter ginkgonis TaxID=2682976 RepID=A0A7K1TBU1_9BACT|nr:DNA-3-methyladenine glycosylase [Hymenobacter ginkgonis]MVN75843.1 DNA-3-methyladenine glycosylase [Hymenobacter ginkgonis]